jgi:hypothetical protein
MAIRAKTKNVLRYIRAVVRATEWLDVTDFRVRTCRRYESGAADLAGRVIQLLHQLPTVVLRTNPSDC